ncbi:MAG: UvrD-helicase domain-containing protein [Desulfomonilaceae bacterium]
MLYFADLHVHSKYSRATSKDCNLLELAKWAALKGIRVLATGDFTHPEWSREIREMLIEGEEGLLRLKKDYLPKGIVVPDGFGPEDVRFILNVEISSIYKKHGATRKVHNLVFMPDVDAMERFNARLDHIGNIKSDGRPILGLDSRDLLEIALEITPESFLVPAHVWTPWFSILGSKSGFDSVEECFDDLSSYIFALETGLSSDPAMNHMVSSLDRYTLISNSDTHSPSKLGREANIFSGDPGYVAIREAIRAGGRALSGVPARERLLEHQDVSDCTANADGISGNRFIGTIEFFPEEGKYHLDGHRKCSARLSPEETERLKGRCPVCGRPVTVGVMNRVIELADRLVESAPEGTAPFWRMLPLVEIIGQALHVGPQSKKVGACYDDLVRKLGPELMILWSHSLEQIGRHAPEIVVEAIRRVRKGEVSIKAGFDGEYGSVQLFEPGEREHFGGQQALVPVHKPEVTRRRSDSPKLVRRKKAGTKAQVIPTERNCQPLNEEQQQAIATTDRPVLVQAGPGTGKTRTLTHRIANLVQSGQVHPEKITAVTFTRKAAAEMRQRLADLLPQERMQGCWVGTFHQLGARILDFCREKTGIDSREQILGEDEALTIFRHAVKSTGLDLAPTQIPSLFREVSLLKQATVDCSDTTINSVVRRAYVAYEEQLISAGAIDLDDLLVLPARLLRDHPSAAAELRETIAEHLLVDEFQDVNRVQYEMVRLLTSSNGEGLFVIGDPDQAIYGFRGSDRRFFLRFAEDYPSAYQVRLARNYRSQMPILKGAADVLNGGLSGNLLKAERAGTNPIKMVQMPNSATEGEFIVRTIDSAIGGSSFFSLDSRELAIRERELGFRDFAVLFRLNAVGDSLEEAFKSSGIPYQRARRTSPAEEADALDPRAEAVTLMTIHASKGLEFPVVFIAGCEEGIIPYDPPGSSDRRPPDVDEECRLLYVAMTRAEDELFITRARKRSLYGLKVENPRSGFLKEINPSICEFVDPLGGRRRSRSIQYELFK